MSRWIDWFTWSGLPGLSRYFGWSGWSWYGGQIIRMVRVVRMVPHSRGRIMPCRPPCEHVQTCLSENYCQVFNGCFCCCCHWTLDSGRLCAGKSLLTFPSGSPPPSQRWRPCSCCTSHYITHSAWTLFTVAAAWP